MDSKLWSPLIFTPVAGLNASDAAGGINVEQNEVVDCSEFNFYEGAAVSRPRRTPISHPIVGVENTQAMYSFDLGHAGITNSSRRTCNVRLLSSGADCLRTWVFNGSAFTDTTITGANLNNTGHLPLAGSTDFVNGALHITNAAGLLVYVPGAATYSFNSIADGGYYYIVGHLSRAVCARRQGTANGDPYLVGWCVPGNTNDWLGFGAGTVILADSDEPITGLANIRNTLVIPRSNGIYLGSPTGQATPAFSFRRHSKDAIGAFHLGTFVSDGIDCFFTGCDDVYRFDLVNISPIGSKIRNRLLDNLNGGYIYTGKILPADGTSRYRRQYILIPWIYPSGVSTTEIFAYDIAAGTWQVHTYPFVANFNFFYNRAGDTQKSGLALVQSSSPSGSIIHMPSTSPVEISPWLRSKTFEVGDVDKEYRLQRVILVGKVYGSGGFLQLTVRCIRNQTPYSNTYNLYTNGADPGGQLTRWQFNTDELGNYYNFEIGIPADNHVRITKLVCHFSDGGILRADT